MKPPAQPIDASDNQGTAVAESGQTCQELIEALDFNFTNHFGVAATWGAAAPGRVNFIGEHLDYNNGYVLPLAIDRIVAIVGAPNPNGSTLEFFSEQLQQTLTIRTDQPLQPVRNAWENYVIGVVAGLIELGWNIPPFRAMIASNVPLGAGLSSSAALEVAVATFIETVVGQTLDPWDKALLCQRAEHQFAEMPCGIMDQFSSVFGKTDSLMLLDCRSREIRYVPFVEPDLKLLIVNSNVKHALVDGEYALRRRQCESAAKKLRVASLRDMTMEQLLKRQDSLSELELRRARHVVSEMQRTLRCASAIEERNWPKVGQLMYSSHQSLKCDYEVSCPELDCLVQIAENLGTAGGVWGARMTGGGFGGSVIMLIEKSKSAKIMQQINTAYKLETGIAPTLFNCRPAAGARPIS